MCIFMPLVDKVSSLKVLISSNSIHKVEILCTLMCKAEEKSWMTFNLYEYKYGVAGFVEDEISFDKSYIHTSFLHVLSDEDLNYFYIDMICHTFCT